MCESLEALELATQLIQAVSGALRELWYGRRSVCCHFMLSIVRKIVREDVRCGCFKLKINCVVIESECTWRRLVKWLYREEDLAIRHICRRLMCIAQQGIPSKVTINEVRNVF